MAPRVPQRVRKRRLVWRPRVWLNCPRAVTTAALLTFVTCVTVAPFVRIVCSTIDDPVSGPCTVRRDSAALAVRASAAIAAWVPFDGPPGAPGDGERAWWAVRLLLGMAGWALTLPFRAAGVVATSAGNGVFSQAISRSAATPLGVVVRWGIEMALGAPALFVAFFFAAMAAQAVARVARFIVRK